MNSKPFAVRYAASFFSENRSVFNLNTHFPFSFCKMLACLFHFLKPEIKMRIS